MSCPYNDIDCPCTKEGCPRHGLCCAVCGHNKAFDENCLKAVFRAYEIAYPDYEFECTLLRSRKVWPKGHHNLDIIAGYCGYEMTNHHHALADAEACAIIAKQIL